jgi:hypothetical protein
VRARFRYHSSAYHAATSVRDLNCFCYSDVSTSDDTRVSCSARGANFATCHGLFPIMFPESRSKARIAKACDAEHLPTDLSLELDLMERVRVREQRTLFAWGRGVVSFLANVMCVPVEVERDKVQLICT